MSEVFKISQIIVDMDINTIPKLDETLVEEYRADMIDYGVGIWQDEWKGEIKISKDMYLWSGFHTIEAAKRAFGNTHEVTVDIHGDDRNAAYLLATGENAHRGRRKNNTEKRNAVHRWLLDEKGKLWTNNHIAKQCHCGADLVTAVAKEITTDSDSEIFDPDYKRPTLLKFFNRYREESEMETKEIGGSKTETEKLEIDPDKQVTKAVKTFCNRLPHRVSNHKSFKNPDIKDYISAYCGDKGVGYYHNDGEYETACLNATQREELIKRLNVGYYEDFARKVFEQTLLRTGEKDTFPEYIDDSEPFDENDVKDKLIGDYRHYHKFHEGINIPDLATSASITQSRVRELMASVKTEYATSITELGMAVIKCTETLTNPEIHHDQETALTLIGTAMGINIRPLLEIYANPKPEVKEYRLDIKNIQSWTKDFSKITANLKAKELDYIKALYKPPQEIWIRARLEVGTGEQDNPVINHTQTSQPVIIISALDLYDKETLEMWNRITRGFKEKITDTFRWAEREKNIVIKPNDDDNDDAK